MNKKKMTRPICDITMAQLTKQAGFDMPVRNYFEEIVIGVTFEPKTSKKPQNWNPQADRISRPNIDVLMRWIEKCEGVEVEFGGALSKEAGMEMALNSIIESLNKIIDNKKKNEKY